MFSGACKNSCVNAPAGFQFNPRERRNDYDVTNTVRVSSVDEVRNACQDLFLAAWPGASFDQLWLAFHDFRRLFRGQAEGYIGCDTLYHDQQHSLDVTLAMARLLAGYEQTTPEADKLGHERAVVGLICALFHDSGYIRRVGERHRNGAEFTPYHISRSAEFLSGHLPRIGLGHWVPVVRQLVHFTGYEISLDDIELDDPKDSTVGHLLGTADLLAQMADRCYLEKCRDRLYGEFVLAGIAVEQKSPRERIVRYASGTDLLRQTPGFWQHRPDRGSTTASIAPTGTSSRCSTGKIPTCWRSTTTFATSSDCSRRRQPGQPAAQTARLYGPAKPGRVGRCAGQPAPRQPQRAGRVARPLM